MLSITAGKRDQRNSFCMVSAGKDDRFNGLFWYLLDVNRSLERKDAEEHTSRAAAG